MINNGISIAASAQLQTDVANGHNGSDKPTEVNVNGRSIKNGNPSQSSLNKFTEKVILPGVSKTMNLAVNSVILLGHTGHAVAKASGKAQQLYRDCMTPANTRFYVGHSEPQQVKPATYPDSETLSKMMSEQMERSGNAWPGNSSK